MRTHHSRYNPAHHLLLASLGVFLVWSPAVSAPTSSETYGIERSNIGGGGGAGGSNNFDLHGSAAQSSPLGEGQSSGFTVQPGFWAGSVEAIPFFSVPRLTSYDMNGDGKTDILLRNRFDGRVYLWPMDANLVLPFPQEGDLITNAGTPKRLPSPDWMIIDPDFNADGKADILLHSRVDAKVYMWMMDGRTVLDEGPVMEDIEAGWVIVGLNDFNGDGKDDILLWNELTGGVNMWIMDGHTVVDQGTVRTFQSLDWRVKEVIDMTGDGKADIIVVNPMTGQLYLWPMDGLNVIVAEEGTIQTLDPEKGWQVSTISDFSGDQKADILLFKPGAGVYMWEMDGKRVAARGTVKKLQEGWEVAQVADINGDSKTDIILQKPTTGEVYAWPMDGRRVIRAEEGPLQDAQGPKLLQPLWGIEMVGDFNGDQRFDLLLRNSSTNKLYLWALDGRSIVAEGDIRRGNDVLSLSNDWIIVHE